MKLEKAKIKTKEEILEVIGSWLDDCAKSGWKTAFDANFILGKEDNGRIVYLYNRHFVKSKIEVELDDGGLLVNEFRDGCFSASFFSKLDRLDNFEEKLIRRKRKREKDMFLTILYILFISVGCFILGYFSGVLL